MSTISAKHVQFGKRVRELRGEADMTQDTLAAKIHKDRSYVGFIERGERNPSLEVILALAKALSVNPDELLKTIK